MKVYDLNISEERKEQIKKELEARKTAIGECAICGQIIEIRNYRIQNYCGKHEQQANYTNRRYLNGRVAPLSKEMKTKLLEEKSR